MPNSKENGRMAIGKENRRLAITCECVQANVLLAQNIVSDANARQRIARALETSGGAVYAGAIHMPRLGLEV